MKLRTMEDDKRLAILTQSMEHLHLDVQQNYYKEAIRQSRETLPKECCLGIPVSHADVMLHISFDFAQQIFLPNSGQQVVPVRGSQ